MMLDALAGYPGCTCFYMFVGRELYKTQQCKVLLGFDYVLILLCIIIAGIFQSPRMVLRYLILYLSMYNYM